MSSSSTRRSRGSSGHNSLSTYLREIGAYPLLTRDEELDLTRRIRRGDEAALNRLVCANLRFVVSIAKQYQNSGVAISDLINEGNLGLIRAARKFDDAKGVRFISYAVWWIRRSIIQACSQCSNTIRLPLGRVTLLRRIRAAASTLRQELGREPVQNELAAVLGMDAADIVSVVPFAQPQLSLDAPLLENQNGNLLDVLSNDEADLPDEGLGNVALANSVNEALSHLRDREATVLRLYFGFGGGEPLTLEAIGQRLGVTRERVRQIKERALSKLRRSELGKTLRPFATRECVTRIRSQSIRTSRQENAVARPRSRRAPTAIPPRALGR
jgi:RNA polymerase primary sigma factor